MHSGASYGQRFDDLPPANASDERVHRRLLHAKVFGDLSDAYERLALGVLRHFVFSIKLPCT